MSLSAGSNTQPSFASLQRSPEAWAQYRKANVPQEGYDNLQGGSIEVSIVGYGREAQKVVKAAKDAIPEEVGDEEDVISLIQCLEDAIRIPSSEWALASQGVILQPDTFVSTHPVFQNDPANILARLLARSGKLFPQIKHPRRLLNKHSILSNPKTRNPSAISTGIYTWHTAC